MGDFCEALRKFIALEEQRVNHDIMRSKRQRDLVKAKDKVVKLNKTIERLEKQKSELRSTGAFRMAESMLYSANEELRIATFELKDANSVAEKATLNYVNICNKQQNLFVGYNGLTRRDLDINSEYWETLPFNDENSL